MGASQHTNVESLAIQVIERMGTRLDAFGDKLDNIKDEGAKQNAEMSAMNVHMQNFSQTMAASTARFDKLEDRVTVNEDKTDQVHTAVLSKGGLLDQMNESRQARDEYLGNGPDDANSLRSQLKKALSDASRFKNYAYAVAFVMLALGGAVVWLFDRISAIKALITT